MPTMPPIAIPWPLSSSPGASVEESNGRLINVHSEPLGDGTPAWHRNPGLTRFATTARTGYRGGLIVNNLSFEVWDDAATVDVNGNVTILGAMPGASKVSIARNQNGATVDVIAVDPGNGAFILNTAALADASATATIGGTSFVAGDTVALTFTNTLVTGFPVTVSHTLGAGESATTIATALTALINASAPLAAASAFATSALGVITIKQQGAIGNSTVLTDAVTGTGNETVTFVPAGGGLTGGTGIPGINFTGAPLAYNGLGNLPQPDSVSFFDGYFLFTTADGRAFASGINALTQNALTFTTCQAKPDVTLLRGVAFGGLWFAFTTGSCEVYQDTAQPFPNFPFTRLAVLEYGLIQASAIAGFEVGFSSLVWVAQDFGVYNLVPGSLAPTKVSPPDLDRLIEAQVRLGNELDAGCYAFAGKKFWTISSPAWSWEFNLNTGKWHERWSLQSTGLFGRWRGLGGHPAFGKWLIGDAQSGNLLAVDDQNFTEDGAVQLCRMESGPVSDFPNRLRVPRADFDFVTGVGQAAANIVMSVQGTSSGTGGVVRLLVNSTTSVQANDTIIVTSVGGTVEANGTFPGTVIDGTHLELQGSKYVNAFTSGGTAIDVTSPPNVINPVTAISWSDDNGNRWKNPLIRSLGQQANSKNVRVSVKNTGQSGPQARRWRWDVSDPVYTAFTGAKQSTDPRAY